MLTRLQTMLLPARQSCLLTNGVDYKLYYLTWDKAKVENNLILSLNILDEDINEVAEKLFLLSKESFKKGMIDKYIAEVTSLENKNLLQAMLSKRTLSAIRLELKNITGHNIKEEAIERSISKLFSADLYDVAKACVKRQERKKEKIIEQSEAQPIAQPVAAPETDKET